MKNIDLDWTYVHNLAVLNPAFGEVKYLLDPRTGKKRVELVVMPQEAAGSVQRTGLAMDGSRSMLHQYARHLPPWLQGEKNRIAPAAQSIGAHLARGCGDGKCALVYWSCGPAQCDPVGLYDEPSFRSLPLRGPADFGRETWMAPMLRYFWEHIFSGADRPCLLVVVTDGDWKDQTETFALTKEICDEVASGSRPLMKVVVVALETEQNRRKLPEFREMLNQLDNFDSATDVDVWDHKWFDHLRDLNQLYLEFFKERSLEVGGRVLEGSRAVLESDLFNFGIQFELSPEATEFVLELHGAPEPYRQALP